MKELTIEEKAKRYDEAIEKAKEYYKEGKTLEYANDIASDIFPELKESEGEKAINAIKKLVYWADGNQQVTSEQYNLIMTWLEKQGEKKKPTEEIEPIPIFRIGDVIKRKGKDYTFRVDRIQGGYYHCDRNHGAYFPIEQQDDWELVEQNPAWTPMDEQRVENILSIIEGHGYPGEVAWLNSLEDRIQSKQEWSEEDKNMLQSILDEYKSMPTEKRNWLKSLKERSTWKPSDEQMKALADALSLAKNCGEENAFDLRTLYEQLKKLKG